MDAAGPAVPPYFLLARGRGRRGGGVPMADDVRQRLEALELDAIAGAEDGAKRGPRGARARDELEPVGCLEFPTATHAPAFLEPDRRGLVLTVRLREVIEREAAVRVEVQLADMEKFARGVGA